MRESNVQPRDEIKILYFISTSTSSLRARRLSPHEGIRGRKLYQKKMLFPVWVRTAKFQRHFQTVRVVSSARKNESLSPATSIVGSPNIRFDNCAYGEDGDQSALQSVEEAI